MKKDLFFSSLLHVVLFLLIISSNLGQGREKGYPLIYRVNIIGSFSSPVGVKNLESPASTTTALSLPPEETEKKRAQQEKRSENSLIRRKKEGISGSGKGTNLASLEGGDFRYSYYLDIILSKIGENWKNPYEGAGQRLSTLVYFRIKPNGEVTEVKLEKTSGQTTFDQAALRAVYAARCFPPLPSEFRGDYLGVHFEFEYAQ